MLIVAKKKKQQSIKFQSGKIKLKHTHTRIKKSQNQKLLDIWANVELNLTLAVVVSKFVDVCLKLKDFVFI